MAEQPEIQIQPQEVALGLARRDCPRCHGPLNIALPPLRDVLEDMDSQAMRLGLDDLTVTERSIFDALYVMYPSAVTVPVLLDRLRMEDRTLRVHLWRMRPKLRQHGWRIANTHGGWYRLVETTKEEPAS